MTNFIRVEPKNLKIGNNYLVKNQHTIDYIYLFKGKIEKIDNSTSFLESKIYFSSISSLLISESIKNYSEYSSKCIFYEYSYKKKNIQKKMEERSLRDIMRHIIGDETFIHYLFDDSIDYQVLHIDNIEKEINEGHIEEVNILNLLI